MIDQTERIKNICQAELTKIALGDPVGLAVTLTFAPVQGPGGQPALMLSWVVVVSLRSALLGYDDLAFPVVVAVQNNVPPDKAFREATRMSLENVRKMAREQTGGDAPKLPIRGETIELPR